MESEFGRLVLDRMLAGALLALASLGFSAQVLAQQYPDKPIRMVVPFVAGGTPDYIARSLEPVLTSQLGQRVIVDNRPGAGGLVGTEIVARSDPDGYTLVLGGTPTFCVTPVLQAKNKKFDVMQDFAHIALLAQAQLLVATHPSLPTKNIRELMALAKRHPGKLTYASSGNGTTPHMLGSLFTHHAGLDIRHIPFKGGPQAWTAVISGEVDLIIGQVQQAIPLIKAGRIKSLAMFGPKRAPSLPDVPTFDEAGIKHLDVVAWYSVAAPGKTPATIVTRLNNEIAKSLQNADVKARLTAGGLDALPSTSDETTKFIRAEIPRWAEAVRISGTKVD